LSNSFFDYLMPLITSLGDTKILILLVLILLLVRRKGAKKCALLLLAAITLSHTMIGLIKNTALRIRPCGAYPDANFLIASHGYSFPSGHTTVAFMAAFILSHSSGKSFLFYGLALLVGFSRIYNGVHYPLDVAAGALLGISIGYLVVNIAKKYNPE